MACCASASLLALFAVLFVIAVRPATAADNRKPDIRKTDTRQIIQWHPGIAAQELRSAPTVRIAHGMRAADMASLRDEQIIETPSGRHLTVGKYRQFQSMLATAKARQLRPNLLVRVPGPAANAVHPRPGETAAEILSRPSTDTLIFANGSKASVAQLQVLAKNMEEHKVNLGRNGGRPLRASGKVIKITTEADIAQLSKNTPDNTILETSKGTQVTVGALRAEAKKHGIHALVNNGGQK
jgi:hypothetical protein